MRRFALMMAAAAMALTAGQGLAQDTPENITDVSDAWVRLFENKEFKDRALTVKGNVNHANLDKAHSDEGKKEFDNQASSVRFQIPVGWKVVLYDHHDYEGRTYELKGTGKLVELRELDGFDDNLSSLRWERDAK